MRISRNVAHRLTAVLTLSVLALSLASTAHTARPRPAPAAAQFDESGLDVERCDGPLLTGGAVYPSVLATSDGYEMWLGREHHDMTIWHSTAPDPCGPWTQPVPAFTLADIHAQLGTAPSPGEHLGSPDVRIVDGRRVMTFHVQLNVRKWGHVSGVAVETAHGWTLASNQKIADTYLRTFTHDGRHYAIDRHGRLLRSTNGITAWSQQPSKIFLGQAGAPKGTPKPRHYAVAIDGDVASVFYSRVGDTERILVSTVGLSSDWNQWSMSAPREVLRPQLDYEGALLPVTTSQGGAADASAHELRDPYVLDHDGQRWLFYVGMGERTLAAGRISG